MTLLDARKNDTWERLELDVDDFGEAFEIAIPLPPRTLRQHLRLVEADGQEWREMPLRDGVERPERLIVEPDHPASPSMARPSYPQWLIIAFAAGVIISALGLLVLAISAFAKIDGLKLASASCLVVGTICVALSLLRGQDLEERLPS